MVHNSNNLKRAMIVIVLIVILAGIAVYYFGQESIPGAPLPDETTNIVPAPLKQLE